MEGEGGGREDRWERSVSAGCGGGGRKRRWICSGGGVGTLHCVNGGGRRRTRRTRRDAFMVQEGVEVATQSIDRRGDRSVRA